MTTSTTTPANVVAFTVGVTYVMRSACDHQMRKLYTVVGRSAKFVTVEDSDGKRKRVGVRVHRGVECCLPWGSYSMAPVLHADREGRLA